MPFTRGYLIVRGRILDLPRHQIDALTRRITLTLAQQQPVSPPSSASTGLPPWVQLITGNLGVPVVILTIINLYYLIRKTRLEAIEKAQQRKEYLTRFSLAAAYVFGQPNALVASVLTIFLILYWILTGPLPLFSLYLFSNSWEECWHVATTFPHLYLHSTCVGLFMVLSLRMPLAAILSSKQFRKQMYALILLFIPLALLFAIHDVSIGYDIYHNDPTGIWLPLSAGLQAFMFALTTAVILLTAIGTLTHTSPRTADTRIVNLLFATILYGSLWIPMRIAYEKQHASGGLIELLVGYEIRMCLIVGTFAVSILALFIVVAYKQRKWAGPLFITLCIFLVFSMGMYPSLCEKLFGVGTNGEVFGAAIAFGALLWLLTTVKGEKPATLSESSVIKG